MAGLRAMVNQQNENTRLVLDKLKAKKEKMVVEEGRRFVPENARIIARTMQTKKRADLLNDDTEAQQRYHIYHNLRNPENLYEESDDDDPSPFSKPPKKPIGLRQPSMYQPPPAKPLRFREPTKPSSHNPLPEISSNPAKAQAAIIQTEQETEKLKAAVDAKQKVEVEHITQDVTKYHQMRKQIRDNKHKIIGQIQGEERNIKDLFNQTFGDQFEIFAGNYFNLRQTVNDFNSKDQNLKQKELDARQDFQNTDKDIQRNIQNAQTQIALYPTNPSVQGKIKARFERENQQLENQKQRIKNDYNRHADFV
jgi:predicted HicB family RNase H-like nuclease